MSLELHDDIPAVRRAGQFRHALRPIQFAGYQIAERLAESVHQIYKTRFRRCALNHRRSLFPTFGIIAPVNEHQPFLRG